MKIMIVRSGSDAGLFNQLGEWFARQGDEVRYIDFDTDKPGDYFQLPGEIIQYGPHVIQGSVSGFPLLICQIVCGIPTVVQAQDDLEQQYRDMTDMDPRTATTWRMLQSFTTTGAYAAVTSHKEIAKGMRAQNPLAEYIPRPREVNFLNCGRKDGVVGLLGDFKGALLNMGLPEGMELTQLKKTEINRGRDGSMFCFIAVAPGYELDRRTSEKLCLWGVPIARPSRGDFDIDDGMPFYEYSLEDYPGSIIALWEHLSELNQEHYEQVVQAHRDVMETMTIDSVGEAYKKLYEGVIRKAILHTPVRGW
jgi:hypothetical protein